MSLSEGFSTLESTKDDAATMEEDFWGEGARSIWSQAWKADEEGVLSSDDDEEGQLALVSFPSFTLFEVIDLGFPPLILIFQTT